jgi:hypothetical protein
MADGFNWRGYFWTIAIVVLTSPLFFLFDSFGEPGNGRAAWVGAGMILIAMKVRWELRTHIWFWITMSCIVAFHIPLVIFVPWTSRWIPAIGILPIGVADLAVIFGCLSLVEKWMSTCGGSARSEGTGQLDSSD